MQKQIVFCATAAYQLVSSIYYVKSVCWRDCKKILILEQCLSQDIPLDCLEGFFDEIIEVKEVRNKYSFIRKYFNLCLNQGWLFPFSSVYKALRRRKTVALLFFSDRNPFAFNIVKYISESGGQIILLDEGMSTYSLGIYQLKLMRKLLGLHASNYVGASRYIDAVFARRPDDLPCIKKKNRNIVIQDNFFQNLKFIATLFQLFSIDINKQFAIHDARMILWIGGPLDGVKHEEEMSVLKAIFQAFHQYDILIKTHPREKPHKYDFLIKEYQNVHLMELGRDFWCPVELLIRQIKPVAILSFQSTVLANCIDLELPSKCCYCFNLFKTITIDYAAFQAFYKFANLYFPRCIQELIDIVETKTISQPSIQHKYEGQDVDYLNRLIRNCS